MTETNTPLIGLVGPCCAGKSTLMRALTALGYSARHIAQEHSYVPRMWQVITKPDVLIYLDVSYEEAQRRRWMNWQPADHAEQVRRLLHARAHCHFYLHTDGLTPEGARDAVVAFLQQPPTSSQLQNPHPSESLPPETPHYTKPQTTSH